MALRFRYRLEPTQQAVFPLGGRWVRPRPVIPLTIIGPGGTHVGRGLLDTGADDTLFPETTATAIGIDLANAPQGRATGLGQAAVDVRYAEVKLRVTDGKEYREWDVWVAFSKAPLRRPLLGFAGFLQFFTATFHGDREEVELAVNALYRGS